MKIRTINRPLTATRAQKVTSRILAALAVFSACIAVPAGARAQLVFSYDNPILDKDNVLKPLPDGDSPWLEVVISNVTTDIVSMKISPMFKLGGMSLPDPFISQLSFNLKDISYPVSYVDNSCSSNVANFCANFVSQPGQPIESLSNSVNVAAGTKGFDLLVNLPPPPGSPTNTLGDGDNMLLWLKATGLNESSFDAINPIYLSQHSTANYSEAKVQGITAGSTVIFSDTALIPPDDGTGVPSPLPILGAASAWSYGRRLRRRLRLSQAMAQALP